MSEPVSRPDGHWRPWHMGELEQPTPATRGAESADASETFHEQAELKSLRQQMRREARAQGHAEGHANGHAEGYREGLDQGRRDGRAELDAERERLTTQLGALLEGMRQALHSVDENIGDALVDTALAAGRQLAGTAFDTHPEAVLDVVRGLLREEPLYGGAPQLSLHPDDQELVHTHLGTELAAAGWQCLADPGMTRGGCRLVGTEGELDATRETRWQALLKHTRRTRSGAGSGPDVQR